jgi:DnaJ-domain-containing protein 1
VSRLLLILAIAAVVYILFKRAQGMPPQKRKAEYTKLGLTGIVGVVVILTLMGKMHWVGAAFTGLLVAARQLLPSLIRFFPMLASLKKSGGSSKGQSSTVETEILRMHLDHDSGALDGEVLKHTYKEWRLSDMDKSQLQALLTYCQSQDTDSAPLLESYLEQRFPGDGSFNHSESQATASNSVNHKEALAILGLEEGASDGDITAAHRKLMQKIHPDRGGNNYLAAKINQAKDLLLG